MTPAKVSDAAVKVRVLPPSATVPAPKRLLIDAPLVAPEMSKVPSTSTREDWAIEPAPVRDKIAEKPTLVWLV